MGWVGCPDQASGAALLPEHTATARLAEAQSPAAMAAALQLRKEVTALGVSGPVPKMRGYHTFTALGQRCYAVGGRTTHNYLVEGSEVVAVFDVPSRRWLPSGVGGAGARSAAL